MSFVLGSPTLDTALPCVSPGLSGEEESPSLICRQCLFWCSTGGLLCPKIMLLAHGQLGVLLYRAVFHPVSLQTVLVPGIIVQRGRAWLCLSWTLKATVGVFLQPVQMPLNGTPICFFSHSSLFGILCKLYEHTLCPIVQVTNEDVKHAIFWEKVVNSSKQKGQKSVWVGHFRLMYLLCALLDLAIRVHI